MSKKYDVSPGAVGTIFSISSDQWNAISRHVYYISCDTSSTANTYARRFSGLNTYNEVKRTSDLWANTTFNQVESLADTLSDTISREVVGTLDKIKVLAAKMNTDKDSWANEGATFSKYCNKLSTTLNQMKNQVNSVYPQVRDFANATSAGVGEYKGQSFQKYYLDNVEPDLSALLSGLSVLYLHWNELSSDIENLGEFIKDNLSKTNPFLAGLEIELGYSDWQEVENDARIFKSNAEAQKRIISGEVFYDDPLINAGKSYRIVANGWDTGGLNFSPPPLVLTLLNKAFLGVENKPNNVVKEALRIFCSNEKSIFLAQWDKMSEFLLRKVLQNGILIMASDSFKDQQRWVFNRWNWGRYSIFNKALGKDWVLTSSGLGPGYHGILRAGMTPLINSSTQCWQLLPIPTMYRPSPTRLVNSELGSNCSLGFYSQWGQPGAVMITASKPESQSQYVGFYLLE